MHPRLCLVSRQLPMYACFLFFFFVFFGILPSGVYEVLLCDGRRVAGLSVTRKRRKEVLSSF